jgi:hypothetical protein
LQVSTFRHLGVSAAIVLANKNGEDGEGGEGGIDRAAAASRQEGGAATLARDACLDPERGDS